MRFIFILAAMCLALAAMTKAQDYDAGSEAYRAGDYATALAEWRPLAEQGDADAQYNLGRMYSQGKGVPQDDAEARLEPSCCMGSRDAYLQYLFEISRIEKV